MPDRLVQLRREGAVGTITLDRAESLNALSLALVRDLLATVSEADEDGTLRCLILTAAGRAFCAGGDIREFEANAVRSSAHLNELSGTFHRAIARLASTRKPVICAVNGVAAGGGFGLAVCGDIVLVAESATFVSAYSRIGAALDGGFTHLVPRLIGLRRAQELYFTDRALSSEEALAWGLVTRVIPDDRLAREAAELAQRLAAGPTRAFAIAKRLFRESPVSALEAQMERESQAMAESAGTEDWAEGIKAFLERRKAQYAGR